MYDFIYSIIIALSADRQAYRILLRNMDNLILRPDTAIATPPFKRRTTGALLLKDYHPKTSLHKKASVHKLSVYQLIMEIFLFFLFFLPNAETLVNTRISSTYKQEVRSKNALLLKKTLVKKKTSIYISTANLLYNSHNMLMDFYLSMHLLIK